MKNHIPNGLFPLSVTAAMPINPAKVKERKKVLSHLRRKARQGDSRRHDLHELLMRKDDNIDFHAICVARGNRIDIERVGASIRMETDDATVLIRSGSISAETASLSDQAIEIEAAQNSLKRASYAPKGLIFPLIETGIASRDKAAEETRKRAEEKGYRIDDLQPIMRSELEHIVHENFTITDSWYFTLRSVYVPPEDIVELASEMESIENWLRGIEKQKELDPNFGAKIAASIDKFAGDLRSKGIYNYFENVVTAFYRRIESVTFGTDGISVTMGKGQNDNEPDHESKAG